MSEAMFTVCIQITHLSYVSQYNHTHTLFDKYYIDGILVSYDTHACCGAMLSDCLFVCSAVTNV